MTSSTWVFGYGSLVSPSSMATTIGRTVDSTTDVAVAHLDGYGRRWNYGSLHKRGDWHDGEVEITGGLVVSLGLEADATESCNGVAVRVTADELAQLDWRERDYERTDVTDQIRLEGPVISGRIVTYVPRTSAVDRYEQARDDGRAAIERRYWDLVHGAFNELGAGHREHFSKTPDPDIPVVDILIN
ncbi:MAG: gamma-glutamylcyclotransferase [Actinobacteria bacterium]|nr:gamma-glutamylcyclotransferase [Actinomycetota bacterium]